ncbi:MAG: carboxypeptidase [Armatimonadetes bacterium]|nr:carboxypeptidase [Armatimonadota bacterium]
MPKPAYDRYYRFDELTQLLHDFAREFPRYVELSSIGKSYEGRDIWLVTITDFETGPARNKPAFWCDGNIHASEVSASTTVIKLIDLLTVNATNSAYMAAKGEVIDIANLLKTRAFYLVPRLCPDGAEWSLETPPRVVRSSVRPYPFEDEDPEGLERMDMDGDGRILQIRIPDPDGAWKECQEEPRLLVRRKPAEGPGKCYRLIPEGIFHHWDGLTMRGKRVQQGLDMNRNFPSAWRPEQEQVGAGPFPTSEPEIRAAVSAICERPNICGAITYHTFSGVHLRPPSRYADDDLAPEDLWTFKALGDVGEAMTGYPAISNYHEFRYHPKEVITGVFDDWMFEHRGVYAWTTEIWSPQRQAGITDYKYIDWFRDHPVEHDIMLLKWSDEKLDGKGYVDWKPFNHPQLGEVEIGGWDSHYAFRNPPPQFLESEITPLAEWAMWQASCSPLLAVHAEQIERLGDGHARIRLAVRNVGWLPTSVTRHAATKKLCPGVVAQIAREGDEHGTMRPEWLVSGALRTETKQLRGRNLLPSSGFGWQMDGGDDLELFEWVVEAKGHYTITVSHDRAGRIERTFDLSGH